MGYEHQLAVDHVSFDIESGDYVAIVGENGSGKSTLLKGLLGLMPPRSGSIVYGDGLKQNMIGYLPQQTVVQRDFPASVYEVVLSGFCGGQGFAPFYAKAQKQHALQSLQRLGMAEYKNRPFSALSGGQRQRVLLARALCATKKLILCDEPAAGLDALVTTQLYETIAQLNREGITVIMVTHDLGEALPYASKVIHMGREQVWCMEKNAYVKSELARSLFGPLA